MSLACGLATKASRLGKESDLEGKDSDIHRLSEPRDDGGCLESAVSQSAGVIAKVKHPTVSS